MGPYFIKSWVPIGSLFLSLEVPKSFRNSALVYVDCGKNSVGKITGTKNRDQWNDDGKIAPKIMATIYSGDC